MKVNKLLVAVVCAGLVGAVLCGLVGVVVVWRAMGWGSHQPPGNLAKPGVKTGAGFLTKRVFFQDKNLLPVQEIAYGEFDPHPGPEVCITDSHVAGFLTPEGMPFSWVEIEDARGLQPIDVDGDQVCEFMNTEMEPGLFDHKGKWIWRYTQDGADDMCGGDVDGDGKTEFAVACDDDDSVRLLDDDGKLVWSRHARSVRHIAMADTNGDGTLEIAQSVSGTDLLMLKADGDEVSRSRPAIGRFGPFMPTFLSWFTVCPWPGKSDHSYVLIHEDGAVLLLDSRGSVKERLKVPRLGDDMDVRATLVMLRNHQPEYLAVVGFMAPWGKSTLFVFDREKRLVYHETLPGRCEALAAMPLGKTGEEALLVGGEGKVWEYTAAPTGGTHEPARK